MYRYTRFICEGLAVQAALRCSLFQVCTCGYEGCMIRDPDADNVQTGLEVYRQHIALITSGMELMGGGSRRRPRNVRNDGPAFVWVSVLVF